METPFFAGCWGIFGHGNVAGIGQALQQYATVPLLPVPQRAGDGPYRRRLRQDEKSAANVRLHLARLAPARPTWSPARRWRRSTAAGAAAARRYLRRAAQAPVLQQLEWEHSQDISVNDCFKPVSRYWDRINRPEQIITRAAGSHARADLARRYRRGHAGAAAGRAGEAFDYPGGTVREARLAHPAQPARSAPAGRRPPQWIRASTAADHRRGRRRASTAKRPTRSQHFVEQTGIPVGETMAGKGSLRYDHPLNLGAVGATGTRGANVIARDADLVIGIGTRYSDFTTASKTAFQNPDVRFININVAEFDAYKHSALPLVGDARATLEELASAARQATTPAQSLSAQRRRNCNQAVGRRSRAHLQPRTRPADQPGRGDRRGQHAVASRRTWSLCAAGSLPGDLHKLWRTRDPKGYHLEYGYSTMGYEIAGGLGIKMAAPEREVYVMVGDGSYLMMSTEIVTAVQEGIKLIIVLLDNHGYASIGGLSKSVGSDGFGTKYRYRTRIGPAGRRNAADRLRRQRRQPRRAR